MATVPHAIPLSRRLVPSPVAAVGLLLVAAVLAWLGKNLYETPGDFFRVFLIGLTTGAVYALVALGYTLVYGILTLINFAHGDVFMLGGLITTSLVLGVFGVGEGESVGLLLLVIPAMLAIVMLCCGAINATIEFIAYRPLRDAPRLAPLITAIGVSFVIQNIGLAWKGERPVELPAVLPRSQVFEIGGVVYTWNRLIVLVVVVPLLLLLVWLVQASRQGKAMRATAQDKDAAAMMGIDVDRTISFTFMIAGSLAGAAGVIYALYVTSVRYDTGFKLGLIAFTAAVLGGIGNLPGAVVGAMLIGLIESFNEGLTWHAPGSSWTTSIVFSILILILVFRPEGLMGERTPEGG